MGTLLDDLLGLIRGIVPDFQDPEGELTDESTVLVRDKHADIPVAIEDKDLVIYAGHEQGERLKWAIFERAEDLTKKGERAVETAFAGLINDVAPYSSPTASDAEILNKLKNVVPLRDMPAIQDSLTIRRMSKAGKSVTKYTQLLYDKYGPKGINISNLVTGGYFESYILPTYEQLIEREGDDAKDIFGDIYEEAVTRYPFAVFVGSSRSPLEVKEEIIRKIGRNLQENQHVINIHGIGNRNIGTILGIIKDSEITRHYVSEPDVTELKKTMLVKLYF
jgi:hypothetical protein